MLVGVWSRPLFTLIYAIPSLAGQNAARLFSLMICLVIAYQTWRLAEELGIARAPLVIAFLWLQPMFFIYCVDTMTELVFALVFVSALRLHHRGRVKAGMTVASMAILARPEGFFLGVLWGIWVLVGVQPVGKQVLSVRSLRPRALLTIPLLATGAFSWWLAALFITRDPLYIRDNWPPNWAVTGSSYGTAGLYAYPLRLPEIVGLFMLPPFLYGLIHLLKQRRLFTITSSFLLLFVLHTILRAFGLFGSAGYPRYLLSVSPAIALISLTGWNLMARRFSTRTLRIAATLIIFGASGIANFVYADCLELPRDARAIEQIYQWFQARERQFTVRRYIWCEPYAGIQFDADPWENPVFTGNHENDLNLLRESPPGTLIYWDERVGPKWVGLKAADFADAGYALLHSQSFVLKGYLDRSWFGYGGPRKQTMYLFYKPLEEKETKILKSGG
ncbi:MAG: hypothetical protein J2P41_03000 [Blastocatellia bacterium]|nr:hypothetical protein [Blastocatellia bacterium]